MVGMLDTKKKSTICFKTSVQPPAQVGPCLISTGESVSRFWFISSPPPTIREDIVFLMMLHFVNVVFSSEAENSASPGQVQADLEFFSFDEFAER